MTAESAPAEATAAPVHQVKSTASAASEYGYPRGHLGHLSEHEEEQFVAFKDKIEAEGLYKRDPPSHEDPVLLRYLRARRWDVNGAYQQFKDTEEWRAANDINILYDTIELDAYDQSRRLYPQWTGRRDRRGIPLYVFEIRHLDSKAVANYEKLGQTTTFSQAKTDGKTSPGMLRLFALYENLTRFNQPFCTQLQDRDFAGVPITMSTNIVDISQVGIKQFWNLKAHMQAASQLATAHYPETLDRIFIIGAPVFFSTVWGWIKRWFDPVTVSKIFVLSAHEVKPTLEQFIDPKNIPVKYGGQLEFSFGDSPTYDPAWDGVISWENGYTNFPIGPMVWRDSADGTRRECVRLGFKDGKEVRDTVCSLPKTWPAPEIVEDVKEANGVTVDAPAVVAEPEKVDAVPAPVASAPVVVEEAAKAPAPTEETANAEAKPATVPVEALADLTVSEAITGKKAEEVSEKMTTEVSPAVPATVA